MKPDNLEITCKGCKKKLILPYKTPITLICRSCGSSVIKLSGDELKDQYSLTCKTCGKVFIIGANINVDIRKLEHCRKHIFEFDKAERRYVVKKKTITELHPKEPTEELIIKIKKGQSNKPKIALINTNEDGHCYYKFYPHISAKLREQYEVYTFSKEKILNENIVLLDTCDLVIGNISSWTRLSIELKIPTMIIHTPILIDRRGDAAFLGTHDIDPDKVLSMAEDILSKPNLSYCIVTHNRIGKLKKCIDAIQRYKRFNEDIVVIDNNSTDGTREYLDELKKDNMITVRHYKKNNGCVKARNIAIKFARGRYLFIIDDDQIISAITLINMRRIDADIVGTESWKMMGSGLPSKCNCFDRSPDYVGAGGMLISKQVMQELNYFDEIFSPGYYEDPDLCYRARKNGYKIAGCDSKIKHLGPGMDEELGEESTKIKNRNKAMFLERWGLSNNRRINKPKVLMIVDVPGWAWDIKTKNIVKWINNEFDITIKYKKNIKGQIRDEYDLYFVYDFPFAQLFQGIDKKKIIAGVTAHTYINFQGYVEKIKKCGIIHANSILLFNEVKKINDNAFYVPNGVDENHFVFYPRKNTEFTVGYVGKDHDRKGYNNFIVPACKKASVKLKAQTTKYNHPSVMSPYEMPKFYRDIDCIVIASDMDGTPNQLLESASVGRTFIGVHIGNVKEFHNDKNGFIVERNVDQIAEKIVWLKDHRKECIDMGKEARKSIEASWTWKKQAENYRNMFKKALNL